MTQISPADSALQYMGRIDFQNPAAPVFYWCGSLVQFAFSGEKVVLRLVNHSYDPQSGNGRKIGYLLDNKEAFLTLDAENDIPKDYTLSAGKGLHTLTLFKREDCSHYFSLLSLSADAFSPLPPLPERRIECYGDSVSAGAYCEVHDHAARLDPEGYTAVHDNAWHSYAMQTARLLHAQIHLIAQGGVALLKHTGYFDDGNYGMEQIYDKLCYHPYAGEMTAWDFSRYTPHIVLIAIGQNDHRIEGKENQSLTNKQREYWLEKYCAMVTRLMEQYPKAHFLLMLTILMHAEEWEILLDDACSRLNSPRVHRFCFTRSGKATPGHPRVSEQCEMACELTEYIDHLGAEIWQNESP